MEDRSPATPASALTELMAINIGKWLTGVLLLGGLWFYGAQDDLRGVLYLCLHGGYCAWWLLEQWLYPARSRYMFATPTTLPRAALIVAFLGIIYAIPGYFAYTNPAPISLLTAAIALILYIFGSLINATADVQKLTAKEMGAQLVQDGPWRLSRNINYLGDLLRYLSFAVVAGSLWAYFLPVLVAAIYAQRINQKEASMAEKYSNFAQYRAQTKRLIPFIW